MKKINFEELKDKDLYLDDDGKIVVKNKKVKKKFIPDRIGQIYYYVDCDYSVVEATVNNTTFDMYRRTRDLVFITEEEAEEYAKYLKALEKYRHRFTDDELKDFYIPKYQLHLYKDTIECIGYGTVNGKIWFKSSNDCDLFIREVGIENIKKFMFDIWEE